MFRGIFGRSQPPQQQLQQAPGPPSSSPGGGYAEAAAGWASVPPVAPPPSAAPISIFRSSAAAAPASSVQPSVFGAQLHHASFPASHNQFEGALAPVPAPQPAAAAAAPFSVFSRAPRPAPAAGVAAVHQQEQQAPFQEEAGAAPSFAAGPWGAARSRVSPAAAVGAAPSFLEGQPRTAPFAGLYAPIEAQAQPPQQQQHQPLSFSFPRDAAAAGTAAPPAPGPGPSLFSASRYSSPGGGGGLPRPMGPRPAHATAQTRGPVAAGPFGAIGAPAFGGPAAAPGGGEADPRAQGTAPGFPGPPYRAPAPPRTLGAVAAAHSGAPGPGGGSRSLFVKDLPEHLGGSALQTHFTRFGDLVSVEVPPRGQFAIITFATPAAAAVAKAGSKSIAGLPVKVFWFDESKRAAIGALATVVAGGGGAGGGGGPPGPARPAPPGHGPAGRAPGPGAPPAFGPSEQEEEEESWAVGEGGQQLQQPFQQQQPLQPQLKFQPKTTHPAAATQGGGAWGSAEDTGGPPLPLSSASLPFRPSAIPPRITFPGSQVTVPATAAGPAGPAGGGGRLPLSSQQQQPLQQQGRRGPFLPMQQLQGQHLAARASPVHRRGSDSDAGIVDSARSSSGAGATIAQPLAGVSSRGRADALAGSSGGFGVPPKVEEAPEAGDASEGALRAAMLARRAARFKDTEPLPAGSGPSSAPPFGAPVGAEAEGEGAPDSDADAPLLVEPQGQREEEEEGDGGVERARHRRRGSPSPSPPVPRPAAAAAPFGFARTALSSSSSAAAVPVGDGEEDGVPGGGAGVIGTCTTMCPPDEVSQRLRFSEVWAFERPRSDRPEWGGVAEQAVKVFKRSAAGNTEQSDPANVRPPRVLLSTVDYLVTRVLDADTQGPDPRFLEPGPPEAPRPPSLREIQEFLWNRLRGIARDFTSQNYRATGRNDALVQEAHERMVRCLLLFNYELGGDPSFLWALNEERLNAFLKTLMELYDDARARSIPGVAVLASPNEAEFRAYYMLLHMADSDGKGAILGMLATMPRPILGSPPIQTALAVWSALNTNNYARFWRLVRGAPYLTGVLLSRLFRGVRAGALKTISKAYGAGHSIPVAGGSGEEEEGAEGGGTGLQGMLAIATPEAAAELARTYGMVIRGGAAEGQGGPDPRGSAAFPRPLLLYPGEGTFVLPVGAAPSRVPETHLVPIPNLARVLGSGSPRPTTRRSLVDVGLWAGRGDAAAFMPAVTSEVLVSPSGSLAATDITPDTPGVMSIEAAMALAGAIALSVGGSAPAPAPTAAAGAARVPLTLQSSQQRQWQGVAAKPPQQLPQQQQGKQQQQQGSAAGGTGDRGSHQLTPGQQQPQWQRAAPPPTPTTAAVSKTPAAAATAAETTAARTTIARTATTAAAAALAPSGGAPAPSPSPFAPSSGGMAPGVAFSPSTFVFSPAPTATASAGRTAAPVFSAQAPGVPHSAPPAAGPAPQTLQLQQQQQARAPAPSAAAGGAAPHHAQHPLPGAVVPSLQSWLQQRGQGLGQAGADSAPAGLPPGTSPPTSPRSSVSGQGTEEPSQAAAAAARMERLQQEEQQKEEEEAQRLQQQQQQEEEEEQALAAAAAATARRSRVFTAAVALRGCFLRRAFLSWGAWAHGERRRDDRISASLRGLSSSATAAAGHPTAAGGGSLSLLHPASPSAPGAGRAGLWRRGALGGGATPPLRKRRYSSALGPGAPGAATATAAAGGGPALSPSSSPTANIAANSAAPGSRAPPAPPTAGAATRDGTWAPGDAGQPAPKRHRASPSAPGPSIPPNGSGPFAPPGAPDSWESWRSAVEEAWQPLDVVAAVSAPLLRSYRPHLRDKLGLQLGAEEVPPSLRSGAPGSEPLYFKLLLAFGPGAPAHGTGTLRAGAVAADGWGHSSSGSGAPAADLARRFLTAKLSHGRTAQQRQQQQQCSSTLLACYTAELEDTREHNPLHGGGGSTPAPRPRCIGVAIHSLPPLLPHSPMSLGEDDFDWDMQQGQQQQQPVDGRVFRGASALLFVLHISVGPVFSSTGCSPTGVPPFPRAPSAEGEEGAMRGLASSTTPRLLDCDWEGARDRLAALLLRLVPDAGVSLVVGVVLHPQGFGVRNAADPGSSSDDTTAAERPPFCDGEWAPAAAAITSRVARELRLGSLPAPVVRASCVRILNPAVTSHLPSVTGPLLSATGPLSSEPHSTADADDAAAAAAPLRLCNAALAAALADCAALAEPQPRLLRGVPVGAIAAHLIAATVAAITEDAAALGLASAAAVAENRGATPSDGEDWENPNVGGYSGPPDARGSLGRALAAVPLLPPSLCSSSALGATVALAALCRMLTGAGPLRQGAPPPPGSLLSPAEDPDPGAEGGPEDRGGARPAGLLRTTLLCSVPPEFGAPGTASWGVGSPDPGNQRQEDLERGVVAVRRALGASMLPLSPSPPPCPSPPVPLSVYVASVYAEVQGLLDALALSTAAAAAAAGLSTLPGAPSHPHLPPPPAPGHQWGAGTGGRYTRVQVRVPSAAAALLQRQVQTGSTRDPSPLQTQQQQQQTRWQERGQVLRGSGSCAAPFFFLRAARAADPTAAVREPPSPGSPPPTGPYPLTATCVFSLLCPAAPVAASDAPPPPAQSSPGRRRGKGRGVRDSSSPSPAAAAVLAAAPLVRRVDALLQEWAAGAAAHVRLLQPLSSASPASLQMHLRHGASGAHCGVPWGAVEAPANAHSGVPGAGASTAPRLPPFPQPPLPAIAALILQQRLAAALTLEAAAAARCASQSQHTPSPLAPTAAATIAISPPALLGLLAAAVRVGTIAAHRSMGEAPAAADAASGGEVGSDLVSASPRGAASPLVADAQGMPTARGVRIDLRASVEEEAAAGDRARGRANLPTRVLGATRSGMVPSAVTLSAEAAAAGSATRGGRLDRTRPPQSHQRAPLPASAFPFAHDIHVAPPREGGSGWWGPFSYDPEALAHMLVEAAAEEQAEEEEGGAGRMGELDVRDYDEFDDATFGDGDVEGYDAGNRHLGGAGPEGDAEGYDAAAADGCYYDDDEEEEEAGAGGGREYAIVPPHTLDGEWAEWALRHPPQPDGYTPPGPPRSPRPSAATEFDDAFYVGGGEELAPRDEEHPAPRARGCGNGATLRRSTGPPPPATAVAAGGGGVSAVAAKTQTLSSSFAAAAAAAGTRHRTLGEGAPCGAPLLAAAAAALLLEEQAESAAFLHTLAALVEEQQTQAPLQAWGPDEVLFGVGPGGATHSTTESAGGLFGESRGLGAGFYFDSGGAPRVVGHPTIDRSSSAVLPGFGPPRAMAEECGDWGSPCAPQHHHYHDGFRGRASALFSTLAVAAAGGDDAPMWLPDGGGGPGGQPHLQGGGEGAMPGPPSVFDLVARARLLLSREAEGSASFGVALRAAVEE